MVIILDILVRQSIKVSAEKKRKEKRGKNRNQAVNRVQIISTKIL